MTLDIPICRALAPMLDLQLFEHHLIGSKLAGYTSINMGDLLDEFYKKNNIPLAKPSSTEIPTMTNKALAIDDTKTPTDPKKDDKDKKKDAKDEKKGKDGKDVITNKGLGITVNQNQTSVTKQINTFRVEENIMLDESKLDHEDDIDVNDINLDNNANMEKGFAEEPKGKKDKTGHKAGKGFFDKVVAKFSGEEEIVYEEFVRDGEII
jgi:hypothetical protein